MFPFFSPQIPLQLVNDSAIQSNPLFDGSIFDGSIFDGSIFDGSIFDGSIFDGLPNSVHLTDTRLIRDND